MEQRKLTPSIGDIVVIAGFKNVSHYYGRVGRVLDVGTMNDDNNNTVYVKLDQSDEAMWFMAHCVTVLVKHKTIWEQLETKLFEAQQNV